MAASLFAFIKEDVFTLLFNSLEFMVFFTLVCLIYFLIPKRFKKYQLIIASYIFYISWNPSFSLLLLLSTITTFLSGLYLDKFKKQSVRKAVLVSTAVINFGLLFLFKYYNMFTSSLVLLLGNLGINAVIPSFSLLLPMGISFFTLQAMGYAIDVYKRTLPVENNFFSYILFVSFFPQLVAGPIGRANSILDQINEPKSFDYSSVTLGLKMMAIGFFKKIVIADTIVIQVNLVFNQIPANNSASFIVATVLYAFQLYCDFSGYSDIAIGSAKILGIDLMTNFNRPYFSQNISDYWHRWHISLSSWLRDYLYFPLGGSRVSNLRWCFNIVVVFFASGLWHGADWSFVVWGLISAVYLIVGKFTTPFRNIVTELIRLDRVPKLHSLFKGLITFALVCVSWVFFRVDSLGDALLIYRTIFSNLKGLLSPSSINTMLRASSLQQDGLITSAIFILTVIIYDVIDLKLGFWNIITKLKPALRLAFYCVFVYAIFWLASTTTNEFIYAQF